MHKKGTGKKYLFNVCQKTIKSYGMRDFVEFSCIYYLLKRPFAAFSA